VTGPLGAAGVVGVAYLLGAVPFGNIAGRLAGGVDLRRHGSGRTGATNALRTLGPAWAIGVLLLDLGKGAAAIWLARLAYQPDAFLAVEWVAAAAGLAAVAGHNWSVFLGFRGGRGVATTGGGLLVLAPLSVAVLVPLMLLIIWRTRYVSAASVVGSVAAPIVAAAFAVAALNEWPAVGYAAAAGLLVIAAHRDNIVRLRAGTERRIGEKVVMETHAQQ
jgi:glycerol-3-phosphate acyltransferase PlsY